MRPGRLSLSPFFRSLIVLAAGSASARIITLAALPVLARLFEPEDFGVLALFTSIVAIATPLATLRFNQAIPLALSGQSALCLAVLSLIGTTTLVILMMPAWFLAERLPSVASIFGPILPYAPLVFGGLYAAAIYDIVYFAGIRRRMNREIAQAFFVRALSATLVKLGAGLIGMGPGGLIVGQIVQLSGGGTIIFWRFQGGLRRRLAKVNLRALRATARRYKAYPMVVMPSSLMVALGMQAPIFMMSALYDARSVGYFAFATTIMAVPINVLNQTIGNAYYGEISHMKRTGDGSIAALTFKLIGVALAIGLVFAAFAFFAAEPLAAFALGEQWRTAGTYMSYIALYAGAQVSSAPLMNFFLLNQRYRVFFSTGLARLFIVFTAWLTLDNMATSPETGVFIYSLATLLFYLSVIAFLIFDLCSEKTNN